MKKILALICSLLLAVSVVLGGCGQKNDAAANAKPAATTAAASDLSSIPAYSGKPYVAINGNVPNFSEEDLTTKSFEKYSPLDKLGRCGAAFANVSRDTMPKEDRGSISSVKPSGWVQAKYDCVDGKSLYNRCHLIGFQLTAENANEKNLITGTRYMNVDGMLPFENMVADYVKETGNHVLYRVTPVFKGGNLVVSGVQMEAFSVEDKGEGICFNVYCYNVQPGVEIDYATGKSRLANSGAAKTESKVCPTGEEYAVKNFVLNKNSKKFHKPDCSGAKDISAKNKENFKGSRNELISKGYEPCGICKP